MAYSSNKKPSGLNAATTPLAGANEIVLSQAGTVVRASLDQVESKVFDAKTQVTPVNGDVVVVRRGSDIRQMVVENMIPNGAIANTQISATAGITDGKLAQITSANKVANSATTATNANTANAIVARDASGNFSAGTITATLSGNATTATSLTPGATIGMSGGDITYTSPTFTGAANVTAAATINTDAVTTAKIINSAVTTAKIADDAVTFTKMQNSAAAGLSVVGRNTNSAGDFAEINAGTDGHVLRRSGSSVGFGQIATAGIADGAVTTAKMEFTPVQQGGGTDQGTNKVHIGWRNTGSSTLRLQVDSTNFGDVWPINVAGNAVTANAWTTPRNLSLTGDVTATLANVSGAGAVSATATLANSGVAAGTYNNSASSVRPFTVDAKGRITSIETNVPIAIDYSAVSGMAFKKDVRLATTGNLAATYNNGAGTGSQSGIGATLTGTSVGALVIESITVGLNNRILVKNQTAAIQNGIYTVTQVGSVSLPFILTRATDADTNSETGGAVVAVEQGGQNGGKLFRTDFKVSSVVGTNDQNWYLVVTTGDSETVSNNMLASSSVTTAKIADASSTTTGVTNAKIRHSAGLSVIGRSGDTTGAPADITAATDGHVMRRSGTSVGFGQIVEAGIANGAVSAVKLDGNQSGSAPIYAARAWVAFDGTSNSSNLSGTYTQSGTTVTVTVNNHGLSVNNVVYLDFTSGGGVDATANIIDIPNANTFTYTASNSITTSGSVTLRRNPILASGNVSSVSDLATGTYGINFESNFTVGTDFATLVSGGFGNARHLAVVSPVGGRSVRVVNNVAGAFEPADADRVYLAVFA